MVGGVAGVILIFAIHLALISRANTITWDEPDHIYSGYMSWVADLALDPEHQPLVKFVGAVPLLLMQLNVPEMQDRPYRLQAVLAGRDFIFHNDADKILFRAQMAASIFTVLLLVIAFLATREMFNTTAGFLALGLLLFDPTLLAHGALVTADAAQSCFLLASIYAFYRYVQLPSAGRLMITGVAAGLALASKHSAVLVFPMLLILAGVEIFRQESANSGSQLSVVKSTPRYAPALELIRPSS